MIDLIVVGGGPVGLATAIEAASAGMSVTLFEPRATPVDKACGEGLMPAARAALHRLGVDPPGVEFRGIHYLAAGSQAVAEFRAGPGLGVRRTDLSAALAERAAALGVHRIAAPAPAPVQDRDGITVAGTTARWLVAADGLHSPTRRALGLDRPPPRTAARYGLRRHYRVPPWTDLVEVHWAERAEAYLTPVAADVVGVAVLGPAGEGFEHWLTRFPAVVERLAGAEPIGPVRGAGPLRQVARRRVHGRALLVGDAAGYVDALTGEGIRTGLACAQAAVAAVMTGQPATYERQWRRLTRSYRLLTSTLVMSSRSTLLRRQIVTAARALPPVFGAAVESLAHA